MPTTRPFRFGIQLSNAASRDAWVGLARKAEDLGYSTLFMPDHFGDQLAPTPALMAAADATTTLRVGSLVYDNDYRHPLVLAKEAATIDVLSGGRLELGLGAGWMLTDYQESGIQHDDAGVRVDRFEEGLAVVKGLLGSDPVTFQGTHYNVTNHNGTPKPVQQPVPILVGGGGKRVLGIAGRLADIVSVNFNLKGGEVNADLGPNGTAEMTDRKLGWLRDAAGDRFDDIELSITIFITVVTDDREGTAAMVASGFNMTPEQALEVPHACVGSVEQIIESLQERRERFGFSYVVFSGQVIDEMAPVVAKLAGT